MWWKAAQDDTINIAADGARAAKHCSPRTRSAAERFLLRRQKSEKV